MASPPVILPKKALQTFKILLETPPAAMSSPARMNRGIAMIGKESDPGNQLLNNKRNLKVSN